MSFFRSAALGVGVLASFSLSNFNLRADNQPPQTQPGSGNSAPQDPSKPPKVCGEPSVTKSHKSNIPGAEAYTSKAGYETVKSSDDKSVGCIFYIAYTKDGVDKFANRPITFAFNGGPGSSSVWLHLGALGPKKVNLGPEGMNVSETFDLVENDDSILGLTDLVFIDPVSTGFSGADSKDAEDKFHGVKNDYTSVGNFIQKYLSDNGRWASPKYIAGESYGGVRSSLVTYYLQNGLGINVAGVIMASPFLSTVSISMGDPNNDQPFINFLPSFTAAAWYHKKLSPRLQAMSVADVVKESETYANSLYVQALQKGSGLTAEEYDAAVQKISELTSVSTKRVDDLNLRITDSVFFDELLKGAAQPRHHTRIGRFDSRFTQSIADESSPDNAQVDSSQTRLQPQFTAAINDYLENELGFKTSKPYAVLATINNWPFDSDGQEFSVMQKLNEALDDNTELKIYVASGYYDLAVPYLATQYNFHHMPENSTQLLKRVQFSFFESGHMFYIKPSELKKFRSDMDGFFGASNVNHS